jgi:hypothetical protein
MDHTVPVMSHEQSQPQPENASEDNEQCSLCSSEPEDSCYSSDDSETDDASSPDFAPKSPTPRPLLCKYWEISDVFREDGGTLSKKDSDVKLHIPCDAVNVGEEITISAAVSADLEYACYRLGKKLSADQQIVTPIAEYCVNNKEKWRFESPVIVSLPHFLPVGHDKDCLQVFCVSRNKHGQMDVSTLPFDPTAGTDCTSGRQSETSDAFWSLSSDGKCILVHTYHFSGYYCTHCSKNCKKLSCVSQLFLKAKGFLCDYEDRQDVEIYAYVWDERINTPDFCQV